MIIIIINNIIIGIYIVLCKEQVLHISDTVHIRLCNLLMAAANQRQLQHSNTQNMTYGSGNRWISHGSFVQFSNEPWG